jgi:type II secretory pathway component PulC
VRDRARVPQKPLKDDGMVYRPFLKRYLLPMVALSAAAVIASVVILMVVNTSLMKIPLYSPVGSAQARTADVKETQETAPSAGYDAIAGRNLFRAKLQAEIPKQKSPEEIEDDMLAALVKDMSLKGVWLGETKGNMFAVIDRGAQKGVWTYELGEVIDKGLAVSDIKGSSVTLTKGDFSATLKLFAKGYERGGKVVVPSATDARKPPAGSPKTAPAKVDYSKDVRREGNTVVITKDLADKIRKDNSIVLSAVAVKASLDSSGKSNGFKVVAVDRGSLAEKMGIRANDIVQEVNGQSIRTSEEMKKAQNVVKDANKFEVKVLRGSQVRTLSYEIK